ncbi:MAG: cofactor-independent phosphoglycerate mutase [Firmicutes bacterium]|nr:cofactor-independent phosphoglycerate mutase [Bacillota bacterium]
MKYVIILGDGMADRPLAELGGKTPLQYARTPNMDFIASAGETGIVRTVPAGFPPGSDVANLSVLGYDPNEYYTGRSPLEAVSMGIALGDHDVAFRCNLVTLSGEMPFRDKTMVDYSAGEISSSEAAVLIEEVNARLAGEAIRFYPGVSYRHLMVWRGGPDGSELTPPHDITGLSVAGHLPRGEGAELLFDLMEKSARFLPDHPVNRERRARCLKPANSLWFWGQGRRPALPGFYEKYGFTGAVISAVDLVKGIGICAGLKAVEVAGATGNIHTNFRGKALAALNELSEGRDFVYVHVEAPDEAGHQGDLETKIRSIEEIDASVLGEILPALKDLGDYRIMVLPDHPTPLSIKTHTADPVPFAVYTGSAGAGTGSGLPYDENSAASTGIFYPQGHLLMDSFLRGKLKFHQ